MRLFGAQMSHSGKIPQLREKSHASRAFTNCDILAGSRTSTAAGFAPPACLHPLAVRMRSGHSYRTGDESNSVGT